MLLAVVGVQANATQLELIYSGVFNTQDALNPASQSAPTYFTAATPFTIRAWFDTNSPNFAPPSPPFAGFRAYAPSLALIDIGSKSYSIDTITIEPTAGITVAIFDNKSFTPGRYGIGILQQPPLDGAGIIGDFAGALPNFHGVGYHSNCLYRLLRSRLWIRCLPPGYWGGNCSLNAITPLVLHASANSAFSITLGNYDEDYPVVHDPSTPNTVGPLNSAGLAATPEPGSWALAGAGLAALLRIARRARSQNRG